MGGGQWQGRRLTGGLVRTGQMAPSPDFPRGVALSFDAWRHHPAAVLPHPSDKGRAQDRDRAAWGLRLQMMNVLSRLGRVFQSAGGNTLCLWLCDWP